MNFYLLYKLQYIYNITLLITYFIYFINLLKMIFIIFYCDDNKNPIYLKKFIFEFE